MTVQRTGSFTGSQKSWIPHPPHSGFGEMGTMESLRVVFELCFACLILQGLFTSLPSVYSSVQWEQNQHQPYRVVVMVKGNNQSDQELPTEVVSEANIWAALGSPQRFFHMRWPHHLWGGLLNYPFLNEGWLAFSLHSLSVSYPRVLRPAPRALATRFTSPSTFVLHFPSACARPAPSLCLRPPRARAPRPPAPRALAPARSVPVPCPLRARSVLAPRSLARAPRRRLRREPLCPQLAQRGGGRGWAGAAGPGAEHEPPAARAARCSGPDCGARAARELRRPGPR